MSVSTTADVRVTAVAESVGTTHRMTGHIPALDGVRGLAILLVMLDHFTLYGGMEGTTAVDQWFRTITLLGWIGVDLFFVLSGFLITGILYDTKLHKGFFRIFYARRILRIFPLYYGVLILVFWVAPRLCPVNEAFQALLHQQVWYWAYLTNVPIAMQGWPDYFAFGHFWSLAVEEQFYLIWPLAVFLLNRVTIIRLSLAFMILSFGTRVVAELVQYPLAAYVLTLARMDALAAGALIAMMVRGPHGLFPVQRWLRPLAVVAGALLVGILVWRRTTDPEDAGIAVAGFSLLAVLFGTLVVHALTAPDHSFTNRVLTSRLLRFLGVYSYALYVFHHPVAVLLSQHGFSVQVVPPIFGSQLPGQLVFTGVAGAISISLAFLSWNLIEKRFLELKKYVPYAP